MARILLIEDNGGLRAILAERLTLAGHTVTEAGDGREGLDHFRRDGADLVVTDVVMPETEGLEVLREIRTAQPARAGRGDLRGRAGEREVLSRHGHDTGGGPGAPQAVSRCNADRGDY